MWERRVQLPRRSGRDPRTGERRSAPHLIAWERRTGQDRRRGERRAAPDRRAGSARRHGRRRRETPTPYTAPEIANLRAQFAAPGPASCPACGSRFTLGPGRRRGADVARRVVCLGCGRAALVPASLSARILVITQHDALRDALYTVLTAAGHEVIETADAAVGLAAYQSVPADVVILDVLSPGRMAAPDFMRQLRRTYPDARVVTMAGRPSYRGADPLAITQGLGAVRAIRMPLSRDDLLQIVDEVRR